MVVSKSAPVMAGKWAGKSCCVTVGILVHVAVCPDIVGHGMLRLCNILVLPSTLDSRIRRTVRPCRGRLSNPLFFEKLEERRASNDETTTVELLLVRRQCS